MRTVLFVLSLTLAACFDEMPPNECPVIKSVFAPASTNFGNTALLSASGSDVDHDMLRWAWYRDDQLLNKGADSSWVCGKSETVVLLVEVSDGFCTDERDVEFVCK